MKLGVDIFSSRFARRLFTVFFTSTVLPIIALSAMSFVNVTDQLISQNLRQQRQETKAIGEAIYERLSLIRAELNHILTLESLRDPDSQARELGSAYALLERQLLDVFWVSDKFEIEEKLGPLDDQTRQRVFDQASASQEQLSVIAISQEQGRTRLFIVGSAQTHDEQKSMLVAEVNPTYLWDSQTIFSDEILCVIDHTGIALFCSQPMGTTNLAALQGSTDNAFTGSFQWLNSIGEEYQATYWSIFLDDHFGIDDWSVYISAPQQSIMQPLLDFQTTFVLIILASLLLVLLLSTNQIKRILTPLRLLTEGTQEFAKTNFSKRVAVNSNDEFAELASSFNTMGETLADQFKSLETMAEIDRLILSSVESDSVIEIVLDRIQHVIGCEFIGISVPDEAGEFSTMLSQAAEPEVGKQTDQISLTRSDLEIFQEHREGEVLLDLDSKKGFLFPLAEAGAECCFVLPLFYEGTLSAIIALGYRNKPSNDQQILKEARNWADRVAVALSNAKWQEKLYKQANFDALTGLPNRFALKSYLEQAITRANRNEDMVGLLYIDLDRFKLINDSLGHIIGDQFLIEIANRISRSIRSVDFVARLGGDEFTVVVSDSSQFHHINTTISAVADKLLEVIPEAAQIEGHDMRANASIGISLYPTDAKSIDDLMKNADSAMYFAKANGGGNYYYHSEELNVANINKMRIENDLRSALENEELQLYFQPQMCVETNRLIGAESLLRWQQKGNTFISPDTFIPIAAETSLISDLDIWVLKKACKSLREWSNAGVNDIPITINLSARFFQVEHLVERVRDIIDSYEVNAANIEFELTESAMLSDMEKTVITLTDLSDLGLKLTIDDFGIGYSSLSYLRQLPISKLKIAKTFVSNCHKQEVDSALVKTILAMAHSLKLECIASGVEAREQQNFLAQNGCTKMQGYLFSAPLSSSEFYTSYIEPESGVAQ